MSDTKILQAILDGQSALKEELKKEILENRKGIEENRRRIDKIGLSLAELSDDTPTQEEFDGLKGRVGKIENNTASV